jgi:hypothetical protein
MSLVNTSTDGNNDGNDEGNDEGTYPSCKKKRKTDPWDQTTYYSKKKKTQGRQSQKKQELKKVDIPMTNRECRALGENTVGCLLPERLVKQCSGFKYFQVSERKPDSVLVTSLPLIPEDESSLKKKPRPESEVVVLPADDSFPFDTSWFETGSFLI